MKLQTVYIENFRSIKSIELDFKQDFKILVGINESGKSNILRALSMLASEQNMSVQDKRLALEDEAPIKTSYVRFEFELDEEEISSLQAEFEKQFFGFASNTLILQDNQTHGKLDIAAFCRRFKLVLYTCNIQANTKIFQHWTLIPERLSLAVPVKKITPKTDVTVEFLKDGKNYNLKDFKFINPSILDLDIMAHLEDVPPEHIYNEWGQKIKAYLSENLPKCIYWKYDDSYLLPPQINKEEFKKNPDLCLPLKYLFHLAGEPQIKRAIDEAEKDPVGLRNLLRRVASKATSHLQSVWKDHNRIKISLTPSETYINALIQDEFNEFDFERRSDGFKRFVSFLIIISSRVRSESIENNLILIDEPEIGLHPSGVRYLRDELIKMSETNKIVASTHSIFMIDKECIERHLHIQKTKEVTETVAMGYENISEEEVVYKALGFSLFEILKDVNILFEGFGDKTIFLKALERVPSEYSEIKDVLKNVGVCFMGGLRNQRAIASFLELANRKYRIVSDDDAAARIARRDYQGEGPWHSYTELISSISVKTVEDFIKPSALLSATKQVISTTHPATREINESDFSGSGFKEDQIKSYLESLHLPPDEVKSLLTEIKRTIYKNLKNKDIVIEYYEFLKNLSSQITG